MYLKKIVEHKNQDPDFLAAKEEDWDGRLEKAMSPRRSLTQSLRTSPSSEPSIIAEMKRASPSKGSFAFQGTVEEQVAKYQRGGARAVSVLTNEAFFSGTLEDLRAAKAGTSLPLLRKDFLTEEWEIPQAKLFGADAILLIAAILTDLEMETMINRALQCDLEVLLEIHDQVELERVLHLNTAPHAVGINNRNLNTFEVSLETTARLASGIPKEICRISESGFATRSDLLRFDGIVDAFLIGESLMRSQQPEQTLRDWVKG
jgi:indole-3-glycerol phosphate synthase